MKKIVLLLILLYDIHNGFAQKRILDSLKTLLAKVTDDTVKVKLLNKLSEYSNDTDSIFQFAKTALKLADSVSFEKGIVDSKINLTFASWKSGDYPTAIKLGYSLSELPTVKNSPTLLALVHAAMANSYRDQGDFRGALNLSFQDTLLNRWGIRFAGIGSFYYGLGKYDSALTFLKRSLAFKEKFGYGWILLMIGRVYEKTDNIDSAFHYYRIGIKRLIKMDNQKDLSGANTSLGELYLRIGKTDSAIYFGNQALEIAQSKKFQKELFDAYLFLAKAYEKTNSPEALKYYKLSIEVNSKIYSQEKQRQITGYKFSEELRQQEKAAAEKQYQAQIRIYFLSGVSVVFVLFLAILHRNNKQKQKANIFLQEQKDKVESTLRELKSTQSQLIQSEKMASLGELTAGIAHEIQNPLNFVNNFSEVNTELIEELKTERSKSINERDQKIEFELLDNIIQNLEKINHHGKRADAIVKSMLQHSRKSTNQKELTDINSLCDEYLRLSYHGLRAKDKSFNAKFETDFESNLPKINVIPQDIGRVVLNLINNALFAVNEKSGQKPLGYNPTVIVSTKKIVDGIQILVKDNGSGIDETVKDKIFQPFFTTKPTGQGTGLGLSLSYDILKAHNGTLKVDTEENMTVFICTLPVQS